MTQTASELDAISFALDGESDEALTSVSAAGEPERGGLGAVELLAAHLYDDLRALARAYPDALAEALRAPEEAAEDANLFLKLVCADLEQLLREQHVRAVALVVSGPDVAERERRVVRYRALYRVERPLDIGDGDDEEDGGALPPLVRREGRRLVADYLVDGAELALLLDWTPQAVKRGPILRRPPYAFLWVRTAAALFEDERVLTAEPTRPSGASGAGGSGGWHVAGVAVAGR